jgi:uncharacterized protein (UPF0333 family)
MKSPGAPDLRGQSSLEYLLIFSAAIATISSVTLTQIIIPTSNAAAESLQRSQALAAVDTIASAIDTVYANGRGAARSVSLTMDRSWTLQFDNAKDRIRIVVGTSAGAENFEKDIHYEFNRYCSLPAIPSGTYTVIVDWPENMSQGENVRLDSIADKKIYIRIRPWG